MMQGSILALTLAVLSVSFAAPTRRSTHTTHEKRDFLEAHWQKRSRAPVWEILPVKIGLKQHNLEHIDGYIYNIADPKSRNFGKHWSAEQVAKTFSASADSVDHVTTWLTDFGIPRERISHSAAGSWIHFDATVDEVERLLDTKYYQYEHESGETRYACDDYGLPHLTRNHIDFVMPTIAVDGLAPLQNHRRVPEDRVEYTRRALEADAESGSGLNGTQNCKTVTIECLRAIYHFSAGTTNHSGNVMGIAEFADYLYRPDLQLFFKTYTKPEIPADTFPEFISIDGGKRANHTVKNQTGESGLDFQTAYSVVYPQGLRLYQVGDSVNVNSVGTFNIFLDALDESYCSYDGGDSPTHDPHYPDPKPGGYKGPLQCGGAPKSNVISISYSQTEATLPPFYQYRQCHEWGKMALMGVSVLFSSGDSGVASRYNSGYPNKCLQPHSNKQSINGTRFNPGFPMNCPYITSVGATQLKKAKSITSGEEAAYFSGGGFSNLFPLPKFQQQAVSRYLQTYPPPYGPNVFNSSGNARGFPDVSALGVNIANIYYRSEFTVSGTSASCPIFAGLVTLLNEARLGAGKGPIGFLNPVLYAHPEMFNDVTTGSNPGCNTTGFEAQPGWDPVTGLGTPDFEKMKEVFLALP